ncbi:MAG: zf-HC2 domain-containing protein [Sporichthyaceae bacterium]
MPGNRSDTKGDLSIVGCERWREALSAQADGEPMGLDEALVTTHVAGCPDCRGFQAGLTRLHRVVRVAPADRIPDLTASILAAAAADRRPRFGLTLALRWLLVVIAAVEMGLASPDLLGRWHTGGELSTWGIATAIGFLAAAAAPRRAGPMLPMLGCAALLTTFVAGRDIVENSSTGVSLASEAPHALLVVGVGVLAWLWRRDRAEFSPEPEARTVGERRPVGSRRRRAA